MTPPLPAQLKAVRDQLQLFVQTPLKTKKKTSRRKEKERQKHRSSKNKVKVQKRSSNKGSKLYVGPLLFRGPLMFFA